jgi:hypothetical protein
VAAFAAAGRARNPKITSIPIAAILRTMKALCRLLPARTPRQFTAVSVASVATATTPSPAVAPPSSRK